VCTIKSICKLLRASVGSDFSRRADMGEVSCNSGGIGDIIKTELFDSRREL
jgi:hypothetical protein